MAALLATASPDAAAEEAAIRLLRARHNAALAAKDVAGAMAIVAPDAVLVAGSGAILRGTVEIRKAWTRSFADPAYVRYVRTPGTIAIGVGDATATAAEDGTWIGTFARAGGEARVHGRYMVHWRKAAAGWRTVADVYVTLGCDGAGC